MIMTNHYDVAIRGNKYIAQGAAQGRNKGHAQALVRVPYYVLVLCFAQYIYFFAV